MTIPVVVHLEVESGFASVLEGVNLDAVCRRSVHGGHRHAITFRHTLVTAMLILGVVVVKLDVVRALSLRSCVRVLRRL